MGKPAPPLPQRFDSVIIADFEETKQKIYVQRLEYELNQIKKMGFSSYFSLKIKEWLWELD